MLTFPISGRKLARLLRLFIFFPPLLYWLYWISGQADIRAQRPFDKFQWPILHQLHPDNEDQPPPLYPWSTFVPLTNPSCAFDHLPRDFASKFVLIAVKSEPNRVERRQAIRETWSKNGEEAGMHFRTIFVVLDTSNNLEEDFEEKIQEEADTHGDMLVGHAVDNQCNGTLKLIYSIGLAAHYCGSPHPVPFLLILDDDTIVLPWNLAKSLAHSHWPDQQLYTGNAQFGAAPNRNKLGQHLVSLQQYPYDRYPDHIAGWAILLSGWTIAEFSLGIPYTQFFHLEDVWMGIIAHYLDIKPVHNENFLNWHLFASWDNALVARSFSPAQIRYLYPKLEAENAEREKREEEEKRRKEEERKETAKGRKKQQKSKKGSDNTLLR